MRFEKGHTKSTQVERVTLAPGGPTEQPSGALGSLGIVVGRGCV